MSELDRIPTDRILAELEHRRRRQAELLRSLERELAADQDFVRRVAELLRGLEVTTTEPELVRLVGTPPDQLRPRVGPMTSRPAGMAIASGRQVMQTPRTA